MIIITQAGGFVNVSTRTPRRAFRGRSATDPNTSPCHEKVLPLLFGGDGATDIADDPQKAKETPLRAREKARQLFALSR